MINMAQPEIQEKLVKALTEDIHSEAQVVYILSRIRKYLEILGHTKDFRVLRFYCNWALHTKIERTEAVTTGLREFIAGKDEGKFINFDYFLTDLRKFLVDFAFPTKLLDDKTNFIRFMNLLVAVYSDTPLIVPAEESRTITIAKPEGYLENYPFEIGFRIE